MKIVLLSDVALRLEPTNGGMSIEAQSSDQNYSPFHMLASSLAYCTWSVMASWASNAGLAVDDLVLEARWTFADNPHRVGTMDLTFEWHSLPANRMAAATRVAEMCAVHTTLQRPPAIQITAKAPTAPAVAGPKSAAA